MFSAAINLFQYSFFIVKTKCKLEELIESSLKNASMYKLFKRTQE